MQIKTKLALVRRAVLLLLLSTVNFQPSTCWSAPTVTAVAAGGRHSLLIKSDGSLWAMGQNNVGQLGDGLAAISTNIPEQIVAGNVTTIAAGQGHSLFRKSDGSLWAMGDNFYGELGDGTTDGGNYFTIFPEQIISSHVTSIAAGYSDSSFGEYNILTGAGSLWTMGYNDEGQLGDGTTTDTNIPVEILSTPTRGGPAVLAIACGYFHTLIIKPDDSLWATGWNSYGQLGDGTTNDHKSFEEVVSSNVVACAGGGIHSLFIKSDGSLWAMGDNEVGQLGDGTSDNGYYFISQPEEIVSSNVVAVAARNYQSFFIKSDGSLWAMGGNLYGQLGDGTTSNRFVPEEIVASNVVAVSTGEGHTLFIKSDGSLWAMGWNLYGQLGDGTTNDSHIPIQIIPFAIRNGGFETGDFQGWHTNGNFAQTFVSTKFNYVHSGSYGAQLGPVGARSYLSQNYLTAPGASYLLSFWLNSPDGEIPNEFLVSWNGTDLLDETNLPATGWIHYQFRITATNQNAMLQFGFRNDNSYFGLDDVSVVLDEQPVITGVSLAQTNLVLNANNGQSGGTYLTLASTNLALPLIQWTPVATNSLSAYGDFTITATNAANPNAPEQFFILELQN